ncbi:LexA-binding, inner membrane-associated putative hydrolase [Halorubrum xinjiangense]|uniref:LexA-binding, inner membrane-associated putative hydrolase n=1 Tax=Halorubrum xinjiangense TaxID=261291 RepID=A0A1G7P6A6_9EURY|nr:metal-dependent hydrolase [Halorubrum xinjiangense]SDF81798.1 LexA-binding, inner membrane-associated putative hydrolase [Halorubrum xinjiangense]
MVDVSGHLGMALLWLAPAWFLLDHRKTAATFVASGVLFGMLPDVDLVLEGLIPTVKHHGVFHTVLAVTIFAAVLGPLVGKAVEAVAGDTEWLSPEAAARSLRFGFLAVWVPGLAHVFADMLSAPDIADSIEPIWPLYGGSIGVDLVWYNNPVVNWGLLVAGVLVNVGLFLYLGRRPASD